MNNPLSSAGLILGASASADGPNVHHRLAILDRLFPIRGDVFADLGCGIGSYSAALLAQQPKKIILADIETSNIEKARTLLQVASLEKEFFASPLETLQLPEASIDCVFMIEVLDHVNDVARCFEQAYRFLKPGGRCYIAVPNALFPLETHPIKWRGKLCMPYYFPFLPWVRAWHGRMATARIFSRSELKKLAQNAGFSDLRIDYMMPPLEHRGAKILQKLMRALEATPVKYFGVSTCMAMVKA